MTENFFNPNFFLFLFGLIQNLTYKLNTLDLSLVCCVLLILVTTCYLLLLATICYVLLSTIYLLVANPDCYLILDMSQKTDKSYGKQIILGRNFQNVLRLNFVEELSERANSFWELDSRFPPLFTALLMSVHVHD